MDLNFQRLKYPAANGSEILANTPWDVLRLGGGFKYFLCSPLFGEDFQFDYWNIFQRGSTHQLEDPL